MSILQLSPGGLMRRLIFSVLAFTAMFGSTSSFAAPVNPYLFDLSAYRGKVVYLDFWASWCGPCKYSFPYMERLASRYRDQDLVVIADDLDQSSQKADAFLREINTSIPVIYDQQGVLATRFNVSEMPTSILIDRQGNVRYIHKGFYKEKEDEYTSHVIELLKE